MTVGAFNQQVARQNYMLLFSKVASSWQLRGALVEGVEVECFGRVMEGDTAKVEMALLEGHEGCGRVVLGAQWFAPEQLRRGLRHLTVQREPNFQPVQVDQAAHNVALTPSGQSCREALCVVPYQLAAAIVGQRLVVVANAEAVVIEETRGLCCEADLHDPGRDEPHLVIVEAGGGGEGASNGLEARGVVAGR